MKNLRFKRTTAVVRIDNSVKPRRRGKIEAVVFDSDTLAAYLALHGVELPRQTEPFFAVGIPPGWDYWPLEEFRSAAFGRIGFVSPLYLINRYVELPLKVEDIAQVCHEANRAYCNSLGDTSQPAWGDAPDWQKQSAINGVKFHLEHPDATPDASHNSWLEEKRADGWKYGPVKDPAKKEHPCFVAYEQLPKEQQVKDQLFINVVDCFRDSVA